MKRREFIMGLGTAAIAWPRPARAQQAAMPRIGFLHPASPDRYADRLAGIRQGLKETGFVEGQNVTIEYRWAGNQLDRLPALAADLVGRKVAVILAAGGESSALAASAATSTIPIVLAFGGDPVRLGLVASLNRPGGNITGVTFNTAELAGKRLDLMGRLVSRTATIAYLAGDQRFMSNREQSSDTAAAARTLGTRLIIQEVRASSDIEAAFEAFSMHQAGGLVVEANALFTSNRAKLVELAARYMLPAIFQAREFALDGGLISYGARVADAWRLAGVYAGRILRGEKPAELPVQQSTKFELIINLITARRLGVEIPPTLQALADEVIE